MGFRYVLNDGYTDQPAVFNLFFGKRYYTWKGKNLKHSVETVCNDVNRFLGRGAPEGHLLKKVMEHVARGRVLFCRVEVLLQTDNVAELIEIEKLTLTKGKDDPNCLNIKFEPHIPKWISDPSDEQPTSNKAISGTFSTPMVSKHHPRVVNNAAGQKSTAKSKPGLMDALAKLKK